MSDSLKELFATHGCRWSIAAWSDDGSTGMKFGPLSVCAYRWFDGRLRVSWLWNWSRFGPEHIVWGGPLT